MISMASRAILSSGLSICLRCQLRLSGLLPYRRIPTFGKTPLAGFSYRRWASTIESNTLKQVPLETVPPDGAPMPAKRAGLPQLENRNLLILEIPAPKRRKQPLFEMTEVPEEQLIKQYSYLLVFEDNADAFELAIDIMRPDNPNATKNIVSRERFKQLQQQLKTQFIKPQLVGYVNTMHEAQGIKSVRVNSGKQGLIEHILKTLWKVEISEEIHERMDLIVEKNLAVDKEDIFFLISQSIQILYLPNVKTALRECRWPKSSYLGSGTYCPYYSQPSQVLIVY